MGFPALRLGQDEALAGPAIRPAPRGDRVNSVQPACVADDRSSDTPGPMVEDSDTFLR